MAVKIVYLDSHRQLGKAVRKLEQVFFNEIVASLRDTARYGETEVLKTARSTHPRPEALKTYMSAWTVKDTTIGAIIGNSAYHSYFVEVGRRKGRQPPLDPILEWVRAKRFSMNKLGGKKAVPRKRRNATSPKKPNPAQTVAGEGKPAASRSEVAKKEKQRAARRRKAAEKRESLVLAFALAVRRKIGKYGTPGRYIVLRTMPKIQKQAKKNLRKAIDKAISKYTP